MDPTQTLPLLPWRERDGVCVCGQHGEGEVVGGEAIEPCSKAICLGKKVALSFTDGWASTPISGRERRAKRNTEAEETPVCLLNT